jgi:hypothetical protein
MGPVCCIRKLEIEGSSVQYDRHPRGEFKKAKICQGGLLADGVEGLRISWVE